MKSYETHNASLLVLQTGEGRETFDSFFTSTSHQFVHPFFLSDKLSFISSGGEVLLLDNLEAAVPPRELFAFNAPSQDWDVSSQLRAVARGT